MTRHHISSALFFFACLAPAAGCGGGGGGGGSNPPPPDPLQSSFTASVPFGTPADGVRTVVLEAILADAAGNPIPNLDVVLEVSGYANQIAQPARSDANGRATGTLATVVGEKKTITAVIEPGPDEVRLGPVTTEFLRIRENDYFVRSSGSDANDGRSPLEPWHTLTHAITNVPAGSTIYVGAGTYAESIVIGQPGVSLVGDRKGEFTGDPGEVLVDAGLQTFGIELGSGVSDVVLRGLSVRGATGAAIRVVEASDCAILDCRLRENGRGIRAEPATRLSIEGNRITGNFGEGLLLASTLDSVVAGNLIYANSGDGILLTTPSNGLRVELNTLFQNVGDQLRETTAGGTGTIRNNILSEGAAEGFELAAGTLLAPTGNLAWAQTGSNPPGNLLGDPLFVDPAGLDGILGGVNAEDDDFRVELLSPALDAGSESARDVLLPFRGPASALTSRADDVLDGTDADALAVNLGFHVPLADEPFASLGPKGARIAFGLPGDVRISTSAWDRANDVFTGALAPQTANADVRWIVQRVSPLVQPEEILVALAETGGQRQLFVRTWDGRRWDDTRLAPAVLPVADANERGFDVEYEQLSGDALLVRTNGDTNPIFRTLVNGTWSAEATVFAPALATGKILWVELVPRNGTNEVALVALDDQQKLVASIWDGAQWTLPLLLANQVNAVQSWQAFDVAWESLSGDLLVSWGYSNNIEQTRFATLTNATKVWLTGQHNSTDAVGALQMIAADPNSNRIAAIFGEGDFDDDVCVAMWNGTFWTNTAEFSLFGQTDGRALEVGWIGTTGIAFAIYRDQTLTGTFQWGMFNGGWRRQPEVFLPGVAPIVRSKTHVLPGENRLLMLLLDETGSLFAVEYTGSTWTLRNGGTPLATGLDTATAARAFDLDFRRL